MLHRRLLLEWLLIAVAAISLTGLMTARQSTSEIDGVFYDKLLSFRSSTPSERILLVTIDDESISALGQWPWSRELHAKALKKLGTSGAAAVAYDVLFTEPGRTVDEDIALAESLTSVPTALPILFTAPGRNGESLDVTLPAGRLADAAAALGHVALPRENHQPAQAVLLEIVAGGRSWPHLAEQAYRLATGAPSPAI